MLSTFIIVFRETLEAALIVSIVLAASSGIASHFPSGDTKAWKLSAPAGTRAPDTSPIRRDGPSSGLATRSSKSQAPIACVRIFA